MSLLLKRPFMANFHVYVVVDLLHACSVLALFNYIQSCTTRQPCCMVDKALLVFALCGCLFDSVRHRVRFVKNKFETICEFFHLRKKHVSNRDLQDSNFAISFIGVIQHILNTTKSQLISKCPFGVF